MSEGIVAQGTVAEGFEAVRAEFEATLNEERAGHSAQLAAYADGQLVVDLWGGPGMAGDSLTGVFSSTKGAAHLVVALLVQEGVLELDRKVASYWPEFAAEGKGDITLRELLAHRAGLVGVEGGFTAEELADDRAIAARLAAERPYWRPGAGFGYHAYVIGALTGEVVLRATGQTMQEVYEARIRAPHGLDLYMGLPEDQEHRVLDAQPMDPTPEQKRALAEGQAGPQSLHGLAFNLNHPHPTDLQSLPNSRAVRAAGPASVGGVGSARGLARMYAAAVSGLDGKAPLLAPRTIAEFSQVHSAGQDLVFGQPNSFALGFAATSQLYRFLGARSFGHSGAAGSQAFADPGAGLAFGYNRRRFAFPGGAAPEAARLAKAVWEAVTGR
ncbi:EstA family serine hydrolase [Streptomyces cinnamoneus]|uniref:EstA family serine hydrolase n=1 Tax=Streptomyces cinnamoneus TaxID=53446 RepID=A0A2G1XBP8_STRCJ|nr:serine hydrolase domain-containing protein [Streptomyces cinnamoneus]PHQ48663.1 EstA family serine hydrolase [Streptomyces cinnamoneus]PPT12657.1 EstA family serine hydrolase [Streptomyces cinnamoneus]